MTFISGFLQRFGRPLMALFLATAVAACGQASKEQTAASGDAPAAAERKEFNIGWSIYAGWMPWPYAAQAGIVKKYEEKYGIKINIVQINDYVESVNQYTAGKLDGVTVTNMDALTIPAAGGKDTTALILGDYSNGNDGVVSKTVADVAGLKGQPVNLVELSVSHYLLARALDKNGLKLADVKTTNTSDADIVGAFATPAVSTVVTWNPQLGEVQKAAGAKLLFSSAQIPGEILDLLVVDTNVLKANPKLGQALVEIWYETMAVMSAQTPEGAKARADMGALSGTDGPGFEAQLKTTFMYYTAADALAAVTAPALVETMERVRQFSFEKGLFGAGAKSVDSIGISFPGGKTLGDANAVKLRFDDTYMRLAAEGKL
jgi:NitT/TauT family transport system substrate-binding protein